MNKKIIVFFSLCLVLSFLMGCSPEETDMVEQPSIEEPSTPVESKKVLRIGMATDVMSFDMANYVASNDLIPGSWIYDTLVKIDKNINPVPNLATSWEQLSDTSWQFTLRDDVFFTDGTQLNAEAVKFALERASVTPRSAAYSGFIDSLEVVEEFKLILNTKQPFTPILKNLSTPFNSVFSMEAYLNNGGTDGGGDEWMVTNPVGSGPYQLVEMVLNDHSYYELNPNYWGISPKIDRIEVYVIPEESTRFIALQQGEVDLIYAPPPDQITNIENDPKLSMIMSPRARNVFIGMNTEAGVLSDPLLRQAIQLSINNNEIVDTILEGSQRKVELNGLIPVEVCESPFPIGEEYNPDKAKELLAQSSYNGEAITFWTPENRYMRDKQIAEVIQQQLSQVGINTNLSVLEFGALTNLLGGSGLEGIMLYGWGFSTLEPSTGLSQLLGSESVFNYYKVLDDDINQMILEGIQIWDVERQTELFSEISRKAIEDYRAFHVLYYMNNHYASTSNLTGVWIMPNELIDVMNADFVN